eukprot:4772196-Pyramimonas_sp.AAC.1
MRSPSFLQTSPKATRASPSGAPERSTRNLRYSSRALPAPPGSAAVVFAGGARKISSPAILRVSLRRCQLPSTSFCSNA